MNKSDKEHMFEIVKQIEKYVEDIEEMQERESAKYNSLSDDERKERKGQTMENNCWLLQPFHDKLEDALFSFETIQDLTDPTEENYDVACMMASHHKKEFYHELEKSIQEYSKTTLTNFYQENSNNNKLIQLNHERTRKKRDCEVHRITRRNQRQTRIHEG